MPQPKSSPRARAKPKPKPAARSKAPSAKPPADGGQGLAAMLERVRESVTLPADVVRATLDDAVRRGRLTRNDAEEIVSRLLGVGASQTQALLSDIEQLVGRTRSGVETAASTARDKAARSGDPVLRTVDRARRAVGVGTFPIMSYDELTAAQVNSRLADLTPAQLRKVRDYERRNANRKSVLAAVEKALG